MKPDKTTGGKRLDVKKYKQELIKKEKQRIEVKRKVALELNDDYQLGRKHLK